jgi:hypothetical protein
MEEASWLLNDDLARIQPTLMLSPMNMTGKTEEPFFPSLIHSTGFLSQIPGVKRRRKGKEPKKPTSLGGGLQAEVPAFLEQAMKMGTMGHAYVKPAAINVGGSEPDTIRFLIPYNPFITPILSWQGLSCSIPAVLPKKEFLPSSETDIRFTLRHELGHLFDENGMDVYSANALHRSECFADAFATLTCLLEGVPEQELRGIALARHLSGGTITVHHNTSSAAEYVYATGPTMDEAIRVGMEIRAGLKQGFPMPKPREIIQIAHDITSRTRHPDILEYVDTMKQIGCVGRYWTHESLERAIKFIRDEFLNPGHPTSRILVGAHNALEKLQPVPVTYAQRRDWIQQIKDDLRKHLDFLNTNGMGHLMKASRSAGIHYLNYTLQNIIPPRNRLVRYISDLCIEMAPEFVVRKMKGKATDIMNTALLAGACRAMAEVSLPKRTERSDVRKNAMVAMLRPSERMRVNEQNDLWQLSPMEKAKKFQWVLREIGRKWENANRVMTLEMSKLFRETWFALFADPQSCKQMQCILSQDVIEKAVLVQERFSIIAMQPQQRSLLVGNTLSNLSASIENQITRPWAESIGLHRMWRMGIPGGRRLDLQNSRIQGAMFENIALDGARFENCVFTQCSFSNVDWRDAEFINCEMENCQFHLCERPSMSDFGLYENVELETVNFPQ